MLTSSLIDEIVTLFAGGLFIYFSTNVDNLIVLSALVAGRKAAWQQGSLALVVAGIAMLAIGYILSELAGFIPAHQMHWLGLIPITLGLRGLWLHGTSDDPVRRNAGLAAMILVLLANGSDTLVVIIPALADTHHTFHWPLMVGFVAGILGASLMLRPVLNNRRFHDRLDKIGPWLAPVVMICVGLYVLFDTETDHM